MSNIDAKEISVGDLFRISDRKFVIPIYQRPYSWNKENVEKLFDDLYDFYKEQEETDDYYFFGSIVLVERQDKHGKYFDVVDGQQRLTSLTIFLACLEHFLSVKLFEDKSVSKYQDYLKLHEMIIRNDVGGFKGVRLIVRSEDRYFFENYVQQINGTSLDVSRFKELLTMDPLRNQSDSQKNMIINAKALYERLDETFMIDSTFNAEDFINFIDMLTSKCALVKISSSSQSSSFRIFSILNSRGRPLLASDIIKAKLLNSLDLDKQSQYVYEWNKMQDELGMDNNHSFENFLLTLRMIVLMAKSKRSLLDDLSDNLTKDPLEFMDLMKNYYEQYKIVNRLREYECEVEEKENQINAVFDILSRIEGNDWIPLATVLLHKYYNKVDLLLVALKKLERLVSFMFMCSGNDENTRIKRYCNILKQLQKKEINDIQLINLSKNEINLLLDTLDGNIYELTAKKRNFIILRLDRFFAASDVDYSKNTSLTIEHILPQTLSKEWSGWSEKRHQEWVHRLANLIPLNRKKNSSSQNKSYAQKKKLYYNDRNGGVNNYALAVHATANEEWTLKTLEKRQKELLDKFIECWNLDVNDAYDDHSLIYLNIAPSKIKINNQEKDLDLVGKKFGSDLFKRLMKEIKDIFLLENKNWDNLKKNNPKVFVDPNKTVVRTHNLDGDIININWSKNELVNIIDELINMLYVDYGIHISFIYDEKNLTKNSEDLDINQVTQDTHQVTQDASQSVQIESNKEN